MTPPVAPQSNSDGRPSAAFVCADQKLGKLRERPEFLATSKGRRASAPGLNLQGLNRGDDGPARVGFTATKKVGNAVARNRAKRRLRALAAKTLTGVAKPGWNYVLVARPDATNTRAWSDLQRDLLEALTRVHG